MSGYVCAMKPLKLARAGKPEDVRKAITSSAFKRFLRLAAPAIFATAISWFLDQVGAFNTARSLPWDCWFHFFTPPEIGFRDSLIELFRSFVESLLPIMLIIASYLELRRNDLVYSEKLVRRCAMDISLRNTRGVIGVPCTDNHVPVYTLLAHLGLPHSHSLFPLLRHRCPPQYSILFRSASCRPFPRCWQSQLFDLAVMEQRFFA
jgi:hypothetical protein